MTPETDEERSLTLSVGAYDDTKHQFCILLPIPEGLQPQNQALFDLTTLYAWSKELYIFSWAEQVWRIFLKFNEAPLHHKGTLSHYVKGFWKRKALVHPSPVPETFLFKSVLKVVSGLTTLSASTFAHVFVCLCDMWYWPVFPDVKPHYLDFLRSFEQVPSSLICSFACCLSKHL